MKLLVIAAFIGIVISLGSALYYLLHDKSRSPRTVKALTTRISLSIALFFFLLFAASMGWIKPHGLNPHQPAQKKALPSSAFPNQNQPVQSQ
ncbi:MAG TPA: twin transmembrane helix small protein [Methylothermaceae bacterium]|nr:twin transmembrane helix small protein [Methylothermaceae bacterium]